MNRRFDKGKKIGLNLAESDPKTLDEILSVLHPASQFRQGLIAGFLEYDKEQKPRAGDFNDWICKCGNSFSHEGYRSFDEDGKTSYSDSSYFCCKRCGYTDKLKILRTTTKHPKAPDREIPLKVYENTEKRKKILADIKKQKRDKKQEQMKDFER